MFIMWSTKDHEAVLMHPVVSSVSLGIQLTVGGVLIGQELYLAFKIPHGDSGKLCQELIF